MTTAPDLSMLAELSLFQNLMPDQWVALSTHLHRRTVAAGTHLMTAEQPGEAAYVLVKGTLKVQVEQADGSCVILAILGPGDIVGEMSLVEQAGRSATVVTLEESQLVWIDRASFWTCLQTMPQLGLNLNRILSGRLRLANAQIQALSTLDVYGRVACQLLAFAQAYGTTAADGDILIPIRLTQSDLSDLIGASRVRVNQVIVVYKRRKFVSVDQHYHFTIHNAPALAKRCQL